MKILLAVVAFVIVALIVVIIVPSLPSYHFASTSEARSFGHNEDAQIVGDL